MTSQLAQRDPDVYAAIQEETQRQEYNLELIASENVVSEAVLEAQGSVLTNKYAEGYPQKRYYGGCEYVDVVEQLAIDRAKALFGAEHVNVQPHSGAQANMAAYFSQLQPGDTILSMNLSHGGHLTHGSPVNFSGKFFQVVPYGVREDNQRIDYAEIAALARQHRPKMIVAGHSAYPRQIDTAPFRDIADEVGALLMVDIAHFAGLVAAGLHPSPVPYADLVTTTTHKTLRGPRGGMILCRQDLGQKCELVGLSRSSGRAADACDCGQGRSAEGGGNTGVSSLPAADYHQCASPGRQSRPTRVPPGLGRYGEPSDAARSARDRTDRQSGPGNLGSGSDYGQ